MRRANPEDRQRLVELMAEFYDEAGYQLDRRRAGRAFSTLLSDEQLGQVWLIQSDFQDAGYVVLTLGYSMEYGGCDGFVDDLFIREPYRNRGLGTTALAHVVGFAENMGVRALHLEVARDSPAAQLYRRAGFVDNDRQLLTLKLAEPTHRSPA
jgi:GNAT superfamily N-acetyltransferase